MRQVARFSIYHHSGHQTTDGITKLSVGQNERGQMVRGNCHDWLAIEWKTDHVRKNIGQLNAIIERKETNVKFEFDTVQNGRFWVKNGFFSRKTVPDVRDNE